MSTRPIYRPFLLYRPFVRSSCSWPWDRRREKDGTSRRARTQDDESVRDINRSRFEGTEYTHIDLDVDSVGNLLKSITTRLGSQGDEEGTNQDP